MKIKLPSLHDFSRDARVLIIASSLFAVSFFGVIAGRLTLIDGGTDLDLAWAMVWSLSGKDRGHHFLEADEHEHERVGMSLIGG